MNLKALKEDRHGKKLNVGDFVIYWHKRIYGKSLPDIGQVTHINTIGVAYLEYGPEKFICERRVSGITKISEGEAMIFTLEREMTYDV